MAEKINASYVSRILRMRLLAPDIVALPEADACEPDAALLYRLGAPTIALVSSVARANARAAQPLRCLSPVPPAATFAGLLNLPQLMLEPGHQVFSGLHPAPFIENLSLGLNDAPLRGLALTTNMIYLLL